MADAASSRPSPTGRLSSRLRGSGRAWVPSSVPRPRTETTLWYTWPLGSGWQENEEPQKGEKDYCLSQAAKGTRSWINPFNQDYALYVTPWIRWTLVCSRGHWALCEQNHNSNCETLVKNSHSLFHTPTDLLLAFLPLVAISWLVNICW